MKKWTRLIAILVLAGMLFSMVGCYGKFALTRKVYEFNGSVGNKFVNTIVMWVMYFVPVYGFAILIDAAILNLIEFWTGSNPMAMAPGQVEKQTIENDGKTYEIVATQNRFDIQQTSGTDAGKTVSLVFEPTTGDWQLVSGEKSYTVAKVHGDKMDLIYPNGTVNTVNVR